MTERADEGGHRRVHWPTLWAALGVVLALGVVGWLISRQFGESPQEPPPADVLPEAPGPDNRSTTLPADLPEGES